MENPTALLTQPCLCQSGKQYADCCAPLHTRQILPANAEQLMRSRYCAYVLQLIDYIVETTVPSQQQLLDQTILQQWAETTNWIGLKIVSHREKLSKIHSAVEFNAFFATDEGKQVHNERSLFVQINGRWYFVDPTVPLPNNKQPCVCGSGKKFKACCGGLL
ncbi:YchJ family protein [Basfia succiniciproducens]|uniref:YchJ family protein n=1 Tax=Basfia succiniciproducens TaxID=653940 RepID=UPI0008BC4C28|nr:YchJ family protein [Basfia succiniciproducens]SEQ16814.1 SEC-C motif-containing protein [Basfia succiniciproducens]